MYDPQKLTILPGWTEKTFELRSQAQPRLLPQRRTDRDEPAPRDGLLLRDDLADRPPRGTADRPLLKEKGLYENTLIVFTADHGEYLGYHHMLLKGNHMYDPLVKVPLVIKWPRGRSAGQVSDGW